MPTRRDEDRARAIGQNANILESAEQRAAREFARAYNQARQELTGSIISRWIAADTVTPGQAVDILRRLGILNEIDRRMMQLESELQVTLRGIVQSSNEIALEQIRREISLLPSELRPNLFNFSQIDNQTIERFVPVAMTELNQITASAISTIRRELQVGLIQGESFPNLVRRLMSQTEPSVWRRGETSVMLFARRTVIFSFNGSKQAALSTIQVDIPEVKKQLIADISPETTDCCLRAHGQAVDIGSRFVLTGTPRFADEMMHPPFHWNCRSSIAMYHPFFETSRFSTSVLQASAQAELTRRDK